MEKEIGGYFSLELPIGQEYHSDALRLNCGRSALQYILKAHRYRKIYLPAYICNSVLQPILEEQIAYEYYSINEKFEPLLEINLLENEAILYVNYFGIHDAVVCDVVKKFKNVIIDNTQAFYTKPISGVSTFYSARKFFGVPDGAYLYTDSLLNQTFELDHSYTRMEHLLQRIDLTATDGYDSFLKNESEFDYSGIRQMSKLTRSMLSSIDYDRCKKQRRDNYMYLHRRLGHINCLDLPSLGSQVPMIYPFISDAKELREYLIQNKIYVATYWKEVVQRVSVNSLEKKFTESLLPIPIDQRYTEKEMEFIVQLILEWL